MRPGEQASAASEGLQRFRAIFDQAAVGIAVSELDGTLAEVNRKFTEIVGYSAEELRSMSSLDFTHPEDLPQTRANVEGLLAGRIADYIHEKRYLRKDGRIVWSRTTATLVRDAEGRPRHFVGIIEDISQQVRAEEELRSARAHAERMSELKDEFLATLSHELRTPLGAILGWSHLLRSRETSHEELQRALEVIERNARAQAALIEDLLDMARITSGQVRVDVQPVEPASFVDAALETVRPAAEAKGIRLHRLLDPKAGPISGDGARLQQVVWNLLSNAIKFTPRDGRVQVVLERVESHVALRVADTGVGIRPEFLPHVFDRFRQADASSTRRHGGLGLGLSIAKHLVELHGGTLRAHSEGEGRGATFVVELPLIAARPGAIAGRVHAVAPAPVPAAFEQPDLSGIKVLAVDDQADARDLVKRILEDCGARVFTAGSAEEALAVLRRELPHVLLSDIGMPQTDGIELLRQIRALGADRGGNIPAIALTAFARSEDRTRALRAGYRLHLSKPVEPSELVVTVASVAGRSGH